MKTDISALREFLKKSITGDNADTIASLNDSLDSLVQENESLTTENSQLKDKIINLPHRTTATNEEPKDENQPKKTWDEISNDALKKALAYKEE